MNDSTDVTLTGTYSARIRRAALLVLIAAATLVSGDKGEKKEVKWVDFNQGFAEARKSDKKILLDVYTDWCKWCKVLDSNVYRNDSVARYLDKRYVTIKLNAESAKSVKYKDTTFSEMDLSRAFGVNGYPTVIIFDEKGEPLTLFSGYRGPEWFMPVLTFIGENYYKTMKWDEWSKQQAQKANGQEKNKP